MKLIGPTTGFAAMILGPFPALAQRQVYPNEPFNNFHMWMRHSGWTWHGWLLFIPLVLMLLALIGAIVVIVWLFRLLGFGANRIAGYPRMTRSSAIAILEERFARGEINESEFEAKRRLLRRR